MMVNFIIYLAEFSFKAYIYIRNNRSPHNLDIAFLEYVNALFR